MQVFKYRYICNHVATLDEDNKVMTGYYNHFRTVMCIIICMVGFNVFNIISEVLFLIKFWKWEWGEVWCYWWLAEGLCAAFEESIILFAVVMFYQIACYFQGHKFRFLMLTVVIVLQFLNTSIQTGFVVNIIWDTDSVLKIYQRNISLDFGHQQLSNLGPYIALSIVSVIPSIFILGFLLRFPMIFSFIRSTQRVVSKYINTFLNDMNTDDIDYEHFAYKMRAGKLFQIAGWGTIFVTFMALLVYVFQYVIMMSIISSIFFVSLKCFSTLLTTLQYIVMTGFAIIQFFTILPSILYCIFLIMLWLYFRDKTKVKYSGYRSDDPEILTRIHHRSDNVELSNQDKYHYTYYKRKYTVMYTTYVVCIVVTSLLFAGFFTPVLESKWKWDISLEPGNYYLLKGSVLDSSNCDNRSFVLKPHGDSDLHCNKNILAGKIIENETHYLTYTYDSSVSILWLPNNSFTFQQVNSTIDNYKDYYRPLILLKSQYPCYYPVHDNELSVYSFDRIFSDKLGKDSCKGAEVIQDIDLETQPDCNDTSESGELICRIKYSGMYTFNFTSDNSTITVKQFGNVINDSNIIPLHEVRGKQLHEYGVVVFNSTMNITDNSTVCPIHATCNFHLAFRILMPFLILLTSMLLLTTCLILILKI